MDKILEILKEKIRNGDSRGVFISPILSLEDKGALVKSLEKPLIFAYSPVCPKGEKRVVELEIHSVLDSMWRSALKEKSDFRTYRGLDTMSYEQFTEYLVNTFGSFGIIIIMRRNPIGFGGVQHHATIDELEDNSAELAGVTETEFLALRKLQEMSPGINTTHETSSEEVFIEGTELMYDNHAIYFEDKMLFKARTVCYIILKELLERSTKGLGPINRPDIVSILLANDHEVSVDTVKSKISQIREILGDVCGEEYRYSIRNERGVGYYFEL